MQVYLKAENCFRSFGRKNVLYWTLHNVFQYWIATFTTLDLTTMYDFAYEYEIHQICDSSSQKH